MDIRDLHYFEVIAETGHMGRAAEKLFRTQPALTKSVHRLEEYLGSPLFDRTGRRLRLTLVGELLLERARALRHTMDSTTRELKDFASGSAGHIRLGCAPTLGLWLLPSVVGALAREAPNVSFELNFAMGKNLADMLYANHLDIAMSYLEVREREGFACEHLLPDEVVVAARHDHPIFDRAYTVHDLNRYKWILPAPSMYTRRWLNEKLVSLKCGPPRILCETNAQLYLADMVNETGALAFISRRNLGFSGGGAPLREVVLPKVTLKRNFTIMYRTDGYISAAAQRFIQMLRGCAKKLAGRKKPAGEVSPQAKKRKASH